MFTRGSNTKKRTKTNKQKRKKANPPRFTKLACYSEFCRVPHETMELTTLAVRPHPLTFRQKMLSFPYLSTPYRSLLIGNSFKLGYPCPNGRPPQQPPSHARTPVVPRPINFRGSPVIGKACGEGSQLRFHFLHQRVRTLREPSMCIPARASMQWVSGAQSVEDRAGGKRTSLTAMVEGHEVFDLGGKGGMEERGCGSSMMRSSRRL